MRRAALYPDAPVSCPPGCEDEPHKRRSFDRDGVRRQFPRRSIDPNLICRQPMVTPPSSMLMNSRCKSSGVVMLRWITFRSDRFYAAIAHESTTRSASSSRTSPSQASISPPLTRAGTITHAYDQTQRNRSLQQCVPSTVPSAVSAPSSDA